MSPESKQGVRKTLPSQIPNLSQKKSTCLIHNNDDALCFFFSFKLIICDTLFMYAILTVLLRHNLHNKVQPLKVYNSVDFSVFSELCSHHYNFICRRSHYPLPKKTLVPISSYSPPCAKPSHCSPPAHPLPSPGLPLIHFLFLWFFFKLDIAWQSFPWLIIRIKW